MALHVRELTDDERAKIERLTRSRTAPLRLARRAWIIKLSADGEKVPAIAEQVGLGKDVVRHWIHCFNADGLAGLDDAPRSGRPYTYSEEERSKVIAKARSVPPNGSLLIPAETAPSFPRKRESIAYARHWIPAFAGMTALSNTRDRNQQSTAKPEGDEVPPTCHWTLDQLQEELNKEGLPIKRSQIRRILKVEHIKWQKPRTWLESDDPEFAEKRGRSSSSTPNRRRAA